MKMHAKILLVLALLASSAALAKYVGRFYCGTSCQVGAGLAGGDTFNFIHSVVNRSVSSWVDSNGNPNQVTICNGTKCSLYTYVKLSGQFIAEGYYYSSWTGAGGGGDGGAGGIGGGSCGIDAGIVGYRAVYASTQSCTPTGCRTEQVLVGYEPIYGTTTIGAC